MALFSVWTARHVCIGISYIYPIYASTTVLQNCNTTQFNSITDESIRQWITFWTVNACLWGIDMLADIITKWVSIPLYYEAKIILLTWLAIPPFCGARLLYEKYIQPTFLLHEEKLDANIEHFQRRASDTLMQLCKDGANIALQKGSEIVVQSQQYVATQLVQQVILGNQKSNNEIHQIPSLITSFLAANPGSGIEKCDSKCQAAKTNIPGAKAIEELTTTEKKEKSPAKKKKHERNQNLLTSFKGDLVDGYKIRYLVNATHAEERILRLQTLKSYFLLIEKNDIVAPPESVDWIPKGEDQWSENLPPPTFDARQYKSVTTLLTLNIEQVAAYTPYGIDAETYFTIKNSKATFICEAQSSKYRDLIVAGLRLLIKEQKKKATIALESLDTIYKNQWKKRAFQQIEHAQLVL